MKRLTKKSDTKERTTIGMPKAVACYWKLKEYEDIEQDLGIDLLVIAKAIKNGVIYGWVENNKFIYAFSMRDVVFNADSKTLDIYWECSNEEYTSYKFKDYGKTWALTKEELDNWREEENAKKIKINSKDQPREIIWKEDDGVVMPFCPSCHEPAYQEDRCVFCGQKFIWVESEEAKKQAEKQKELIVHYNDITVEQIVGSWSIYVSRKGERLCHISCSSELRKEELVGIAKGYANEH